MPFRFALLVLSLSASMSHAAGFIETYLNGLSSPHYFASQSTNLYFSENGAHRVKKIDLLTGAVTVVAGNGTLGNLGDGGPATAARLNGPSGLAIDPNTNTLYIADSGNHKIRAVDLGSGNITSVAGTTYGNAGDGGPGLSAQMGNPLGLTISGSVLYIAASSHHRIRALDLSTWIIERVAGIGSSPGFTGDGGLATLAQLSSPQDVAVAPDGDLIIADKGNLRLRKFTVGGNINTYVGSGVSGDATNGTAALSANLWGPQGLAFGPSNTLYFTDADDSGYHYRVRKLSGGNVDRVTGGSTADYTHSGDLADPSLAQMYDPRGLWVDSTGNTMMIAVRGDNRIRRIDFSGTPPTPTATPTPFSGCGAGGNNIAPVGSAAITGNVWVRQVTMPGAGQVATVWVHVANAGGGQISGALFDNGGGNPIGIKSQSAAQVAVNGWNALPLAAAQTVSSGGLYWVGVQAEAGVDLGQDATGANSKYSAQAFGTFLNGYSYTWTGSTVSHGLYAEVCVVAATATRTITPTFTITPTATPDPCTLAFGTTTYDYGNTVNNTFYASSYTPGSNVSVSALGTEAFNAVGAVRLALYAADGPAGDPGTLLAETAEYTGAAGVLRLSIPETALTGGTTYWLAYLSTGGRRIAGNTAVNSYRFVSTTYGPYPSTAPTGLSSGSGTFVLSAWSCPVVGSPTFTRTPTFSATPTEVATGTNSFTATSTRTEVPTASATPTFSVTLSSTESPSPADTATFTVTLSRTPTLSATPTASPTAAPTYNAYTLAGTGSSAQGNASGAATAVDLDQPKEVVVNAAGDIYFLDGNQLKKINAGTGALTRTAGLVTSGSNGHGPTSRWTAQLDRPYGLALASNGDIYVADTYSNQIQKIQASDDMVYAIGGTVFGEYGYTGEGTALSVRFAHPTDVALDEAQGHVYVADWENHRIRRIDSLGNVTTVAGTGTPGYFGDGGQANVAQLSYPTSIALDGLGGLYISDSGNVRIRRLDLGTGVISLVAGTGAAGFAGDGGSPLSAQFQPGLLAEAKLNLAFIDGALFVSDEGNHRVRRILGGKIETVAGAGTGAFNGDGILATSAYLSSPQGLAAGLSGSIVFADRGSFRVRSLAASGAVPSATVTPTATPTRTTSPSQSPSPADSMTFTSTASPTLTPVLTATATPSVTPANSVTFTPTPSVTLTGTPTPTNTSSATQTPSSTISFTASETFTKTASPTFTATVTSTSSVTVTGTPTKTATPTVTPSFTRTESSTHTVTVTGTTTKTATPTVTPSFTNTETGTASPTATGTVTPNATLTGIALSWTPTVTSTVTPPPTAVPFLQAPATGPSVVLVPGAGRRNVPMCLATREPVTSSYWEVFNTAGQPVARLTFGSESSQCMQTNTLAVGVYYVNIVTKLQSGIVDTRQIRITIVP